MTLVSSGELHLIGSSGAPTRSIQFECEGLYAGPFTLTDAQAIASGYVGSLPTDMTEFYGYSAGSTIVVDFSNSKYWNINTVAHKDGYQALTITGRVSGDIITLTMDLDFVEDLGIVTCDVYWSKNSTSSWTLLQSFAFTDSSSESMAGIDYNDEVRIRFDIEAIGKIASGSILATLTGGSFTSGSGTVTALGTTQWTESVESIF